VVQDALGDGRDQSWLEQGLALEGNEVGEIAGCRMWSGLGWVRSLGPGRMGEVELVDKELILDALRLFGCHGRDEVSAGGRVRDGIGSCRFLFLSKVVENS
jgi:hypothetical protein